MLGRKQQKMTLKVSQKKNGHSKKSDVPLTSSYMYFFV